MKVYQRTPDNLKSIPKVLNDYSYGGVNASIFLDVRYPKKDNYYPVKNRVTYKRKQVYFPCMDVSIDEWENLITVKNPRKENIKKTRDLIFASFKGITNNIEDLVKTVGFSFEALDSKLSKGTTDSILDAFDNKISKLDEIGKVGSSAWYLCAKNSIKTFAKKDVKFSDINTDWLERYQAQLREEGKRWTTISINLRALRAVYNDGIKEGLVSSTKYPFNDFKIPKGEGRKLALTAPQLLKVFNYQLHSNEKRWRDLWKFSFFSNGINVSDLLKLRYKDIIDGEMTWIRQKTEGKVKKEIKAPVTPEMQKIIDMWGDPDKSPDNFIFPFFHKKMTPAEQRKVRGNVIHSINKTMKKIGKDLGYGDITSYAARHSFATVLKRAGTNLSFIAESMGHADVRTTEAYLASFGKDERLKNANILQEAINGKTKTPKKTRKSTKGHE